MRAPADPRCGYCTGESQTKEYRTCLPRGRSAGLALALEQEPVSNKSVYADALSNVHLFGTEDAMPEAKARRESSLDHRKL